MLSYPQDKTRILLWGWAGSCIGWSSSSSGHHAWKHKLTFSWHIIPSSVAGIPLWISVALVGIIGTIYTSLVWCVSFPLKIVTTRCYLFEPQHDNTVNTYVRLFSYSLTNISSSLSGASSWHLRNLAWALTFRICDNYPFCSVWFIYFLGEEGGWRLVIYSVNISKLL